jgi:hypothetical protein
MKAATGRTLSFRTEPDREFVAAASDCVADHLVGLSGPQVSPYAGPKEASAALGQAMAFARSLRRSPRKRRARAIWNR